MEKGKLIAIFSSLITLFFKINSTIRNQRRNKLTEEEYSLLSREYKESVVVPDLEEKDFCIRTGITVNNRLIPSFVDLRYRLGNRFDWIIIGSAQPYFHIDDNKKIWISISKRNRLYKEFIMILGLIFCPVGSGIGLLIQEYVLKNTGNHLIGMLVVLIPMGIGYFILASVYPYINAVCIENRLKSINKIK